MPSICALSERHMRPAAHSAEHQLVVNPIKRELHNGHAFSPPAATLYADSALSAYGTLGLMPRR